MTRSTLSALIDAVKLAKQHTPMFTIAWNKFDNAEDELTKLWNLL